MLSIKSQIGRTIKGWQNRILWFYRLHILTRIQVLLAAHPPIIIYQMGKVGSSTIHHTLETQLDSPVFHVHFLNPKYAAQMSQSYTNKGLRVPFHIEQGAVLYASVIKPKRPAKYITLVREPISRNMSSYFENSILFRDRNSNTSVSGKSKTEENIQTFIDEHNHDFPLTWFDKELFPVLGIDVYQYPFPHNQGYQRILTEEIDLLIIKLEANDKVIQNALAEFLELPNIDLQHANVGSQKNYSEAYEAFKKQITLPQIYLDEMLESRYAKHFYNDEERQNIYQKWSKH
jgi:Putative capsular polysaccharide synthesis protein